jgi:phosphatidylserine/phosphatidylglycerophosphate/cardiolipin synthase-like enzyme
MTASVHGRWPAEVLRMSPADRRRAILDALRRARCRIELSMFRCDDSQVFAELTRATARGVQVSVLLTPRAKGHPGDLETLRVALDATGAAVHLYANPAMKYHAKYIVVDDGPAIVASGNFTSKCFERTLDAVVLTYDPAVVASLRALHAADCAGAPLPPALSPRLIVAPERSRALLTALISSAQSSIGVIDPKLCDPRMMCLLSAQRNDGVAVEIFDGPRIGTLESHGKLLLVDDRIAVVGSIAFAPVSLDLRREVAIATEEPQAIAQIARLFRLAAAERRRRGAPRIASGAAGPRLARPSLIAATKEATC